MPIASKIEELIYFSYITLLTIGYGDITPNAEIVQKASVLVGMVGQFYLVIVTAVVIEKYIRHTQKD
nr:potassium channel family protein [Hanstruepera flava]